MIIAKPYRTHTIKACFYELHPECTGKADFDDYTAICDCRCHYETEREETIMSDIISKTRKPWTAADLEHLKANASKGAKQLAVDLDRPEQHIRAKATRLGISLRQEGSKRGRRLKAADSI